MKRFIRICFKLVGWKIDKTSPVGIDKCVVIMGPHTSNWDFVLGKMAFMSYGLKAKYLVKKSAFFFPFGPILKRMGGIPVDRSKKNNITRLAVDLFNESEQLYLVFTPEGTRSYNPNWKKGFYFIALEAKVPIFIAYADYKSKTGGFHGVFHPTGDVDKDILELKTILSQYTARFPEQGIHV